MASQLTGLLLKAIDLHGAPARGLRGSFALPPDEGDLRAHLQEELRQRWSAVDKFFELDSTAAHNWECRAKALVAHQFEIPSDHPQWWMALARRLAALYVPGFSVRLGRKRARGAPRQWNDERWAQLFADGEYLKRKHRLSVRQICEKLPRKPGYAKRWGYFHPQGLRRGYSTANKRSDKLLFQFVLCGPDAALRPRPDQIKAAIERHALKAGF